MDQRRRMYGNSDRWYKGDDRLVDEYRSSGSRHRNGGFGVENVGFEPDYHDDIIQENRSDRERFDDSDLEFFKQRYPEHKQHGYPNEYRPGNRQGRYLEENQIRVGKEHRYPKRYRVENRNGIYLEDNEPQAGEERQRRRFQEANNRGNQAQRYSADVYRENDYRYRENSKMDEIDEKQIHLDDQSGSQTGYFHPNEFVQHADIHQNYQERSDSSDYPGSRHDDVQNGDRSDSFLDGNFERRIIRRRHDDDEIEKASLEYSTRIVDSYNESFSDEPNFELDINDGIRTLIYRRRKENGSIRKSRRIIRRSVFDDDSLQEHVPNVTKKNRKSLKQKKELLLQQRTTHDLAEVYRTEIQNSEEHSRGASLFNRQQKLAWKRLKAQIREFLYQFELWSGSFKTIEGRFGTAVMSYFRFVRWLLFLNLYISLVFLGLILVPHLSLYETHTNVTSESVFEFEAKNCSREYTNFVIRHKEKESVFSEVLDFLQGTGWMENTELFYGKYSHFYGYTTVIYNMALLYLIALGASFLLCFLLLVRNSGKGLKQRLLDRNSELTQLTNKVLTDWDYCINDRKAAKLKHRSLKLELETDLENQRIQWKKENRTTKDKIKIFLIRTAVNITVLCILGGCLYLIYYTNQQLIQLQEALSDKHAVVQFFIQYLPSLTITVLNVIVPMFFTKIVLLEDYSHAVEMRMTLMRTVLLRLASLGVLMVSLYNQILNTDGNSGNTTFVCGNKMWNSYSNTTSDGSIKCWESFVGQQFYKLALVDFLAAVIPVFVLEFPRRLIHDRLQDKYKIIKLVGRPEFDLPKSVLNLVYSQALCWMGLFFSPLIAVITVFKYFILFYIQKLTLLQNYVPPLRPYRTSRSNSLFIMILLVSFILTVIPISYMIGNFQPSQSCGPFRIYNFYQQHDISCAFRNNASDTYVFFTAVRNFVESGIEPWPDWLECILFFLGTSGFLVPVIGILIFVMYYYYIVSVGLQKKGEVLKEQVRLEGRDKKFIWLRINEIR